MMKCWALLRASGGYALDRLLGHLCLATRPKSNIRVTQSKVACHKSMFLGGFLVGILNPLCDQGVPSCSFAGLYGVRWLDTALDGSQSTRRRPIPIQSGVEPPHSKSAAETRRHPRSGDILQLR